MSQTNIRGVECPPNRGALIRTRRRESDWAGWPVGRVLLFELLQISAVIGQAFLCALLLARPIPPDIAPPKEKPYPPLEPFRLRTYVQLT